MKSKFTLFRRGQMFYIQDAATRKQISLRTKDETEARSLLNARNEATRQPVLNLHLARAYLTASDPAFVERTYDGLPNAWIALNGLQGTNGLPGLDPDQDGLNNMQEYLYGTKPLVPEGITPWVGNPSGFSGLP